MLTLHFSLRAAGRRATWTAALLGGLNIAAAPARTAHPLALWYVVHDLCAPIHRLTGLAAPCIAVDLKAGYAVVPDPGALYDLLLVPTSRITGIEDPRLLKVGSPNYWKLGWSWRPYLARRVGADLRREEVGMAVNAVAGRTQDQFHIHISCIRGDVAKTLQVAAPRLTERWSTLEIQHGLWRVRLVLGQDLVGYDPSKLLATDPRVAADLGRETLLAVGATFQPNRPGFFLLHRATELQTFYFGDGERLLDEKCSTLQK